MLCQFYVTAVAIKRYHGFRSLLLGYMISSQQALELEREGRLTELEQPVRSKRSWSLFFGSLRVQLFLCLSIGVVLPVIVYFIGELSVLADDPPAWNSTLAAAIATIVGLVAIRKLAGFPGTVRASYIFPAFAASYGIVMVVILFARAPYSGALLSVSFALNLIVRFAIGAIEKMRNPCQYYLVPGGNIDRIRRDLGVVSVMLDRPSLPSEAAAVIVADLHHDHSPEWERTFAIAALNGIGVYHYKQVWEAQTGKVRIERLSENSLGSLIPSNSYAKIKRLTDIILSLIFLPILLIPLLVTALIIRLDSPGSVFFRQERIGFRGRSFYVLKFRTMRESDPESDDTDPVRDAITRDGDDRITKVGRFLRKTRIDELPQVFNILRGEMSWIGPRPEACPLAEWYEREIPFYSYRHIVRPGITGWAQI